ncbi:MFS transporter [Streptomyces sp. A3M-1-3]|uniref:MFS transporter n=1 Tax=Streptomyces sp. A3M-1-3 TaxID=2962044 RepID=UPI0020B63EB5|nr:MFS transporter [Streptomyces sp. A3M-1-3]MCP3820773.1 MFS transporter [Streptomyces sp. A3M-1-3]
MKTMTPRTEASSAARPRYGAVLVLLCAAQFMVALDFSILSVALPTIGEDLGFSISNLQWVVTAFALPSGGFLLLFGRTADLFGRRALFIAGLVLFTLTSLLGGLATNAEMLLAARAGQGLAAAMLTPSAMSLLTTSFPEGPQRERALGINGALLSLGFLSGVVLGGLITDTLGWRWALFVNVPVGVLAVIATPFLVKESRVARRTKLDVPGAITVTAGLLSLIYGITQAEHQGWTAPGTLGAIAAGVALLAAFLVIEGRSSAPLAPLHVLRRRSVSWGNTAGLITFSMMTAVVFLMTLYMQNVLFMSAVATGVSFAALGIAAVGAGVIAPKVVAGTGPRGALIFGLTVQALGTGLLFLLPQENGLLLLLAGTFLAGGGHMLAVVAYTIIATSGLPNGEQGLASGLANTAQLVGLTVGIPVISTLATSRMNSLPEGTSGAWATLNGVQLGVLVDTVVLLAGVVIAAVCLRRAQPATSGAAPAGVPAAEAGPEPVTEPAGPVRP